MALWFLGRRSHSFNSGHVDQILRVPSSVQDLGSEGPLAHFVRDTGWGSLDRSTIVETDTEGRGFPPYDPPGCCRRAIKGATRRGGSRRPVRSGSIAWR